MLTYVLAADVTGRPTNKAVGLGEIRWLFKSQPSSTVLHTHQLILINFELVHILMKIFSFTRQRLVEYKLLCNRYRSQTLIPYHSKHKFSPVQNIRDCEFIEPIPNNVFVHAFDIKYRLLLTVFIRY